MKKTISALLVLLALGVAAFFFIKLRRFLPEQARAAELAPEDTILYVQVPNLRETAFRVPGLDLYAVWMEPEWQEFLDKPRKQSPWMKQWTERYEDVVRVAPGEMFLAFTAMRPKAEFVGGFSFAGSRKSAEALVENSRDLLPARALTRVHGNWLFFASSEAALNGVVERYEKRGGGSGIGGDPAFQEAVKALGVAQDLVIYGRTNALPALAQALPQSPVMALGTKIQKGKLHDTLYLPGVPGDAGRVGEQTMALTSPQTLIYLASSVSALPVAPDLTLARALLPELSVAEKSLAAQGMSWSDFPKAFGPEFGTVIEWPEDAALPRVLFAPQVRDPELARRFIEAIASPGSLGPAWQAEDRAGVTIYTAPPQRVPVLRPSVTLTERFGLAALTPEGLFTGLARAERSIEPLAESPAFQEATRQLAAPPGALVYLDFPRLFERVYRLSRPFITLSLAFTPEFGMHVDAGKLPPAEAISKHLGPLIVTQTRRDNGLVIESTGSITITQLLFGASAGATASGLSQLPAFQQARNAPVKNAPTKPARRISITPDAGKSGASSPSKERETGRAKH